MPQKVSAVHGRYIGGAEHLQSFDIIPVIEMPFPFQHFLNRAHQVFNGFHRGTQRFKPKIPGRQDRQKLKPDIGGRCFIADFFRHGDLVMVRTEPVVFLCGKLLEKQPGPARGIQKQLPVLCRIPRMKPVFRLADAVRDFKGSAPVGDGDRRQDQSRGARIPRK